jgi:hypothetical protein
LASLRIAPCCEYLCISLTVACRRLQVGTNFVSINILKSAPAIFGGQTQVRTSGQTPPVDRTDAGAGIR